MKHSIVTAALIAGLLGLSILSVAHAQGKPRSVPYRLATLSGEQIEMRIRYAPDYTEALGVSFDITLPKPDGEHEYRLASDEGSEIIIRLAVENNRVIAFTIDTDFRPTPEQPAENTRLTVHSRSGESLYFIYEWEGAQLINVRVDSERTSVK